jgi:2-succinyl-5-enolpyruvyl-6-hydroxy-3-cyclohexene-1-carboxylate synthase
VESNDAAARSCDGPRSTRSAADEQPGSATSIALAVIVQGDRRAAAAVAVGTASKEHWNRRPAPLLVVVQSGTADVPRRGRPFGWVLWF